MLGLGSYSPDTEDLGSLACFPSSLHIRTTSHPNLRSILPACSSKMSIQYPSPQTYFLGIVRPGYFDILTFRKLHSLSFILGPFPLVLTFVQCHCWLPQSNDLCILASYQTLQCLSLLSIVLRTQSLQWSSAKASAASPLLSLGRPTGLPQCEGILYTWTLKVRNPSQHPKMESVPLHRKGKPKRAALSSYFLWIKYSLMEEKKT